MTEPDLPINFVPAGQSPTPQQSAATDAALKKLTDATRVLGGSRMIHTDTPTDQITDQQCADVIAAVKAYLKDKGLTQTALAKGTGFRAATISTVLSGSYAANPRNIIAALDRWLERRASADAAPHVHKFCWTEVAQKVRLAAQLAISNADQGIDARISLVWGDAGCGKTLALEAVAESMDGVIISCGSDLSSVKGILQKIAVEIGLKDHAPGRSNNDTFNALVDQLRGSGKLIIVDEIHSLLDARDDQPFHILRRLSDATGCPQLWSATCDLIEQLRAREQKRQPLSQILRRIGCQFHLTAPLHNSGGSGGGGEQLFSVDEILKIYGSNELKLTRDAGRFLARLCCNPKLGLLGKATTLVAAATKMNRRKNPANLTAEMLWEACQFLFQPSVIMDLGKQLREELTDLKRKTA